MRSANWLVLGTSTAAVVALLVVLPPGWVAGAESALAGWRPWVGAARIAGIVAAWFWWDTLAERAPRLGPDGVAHLKERRTFWIGALVAVELVVVRNVFGVLRGLVA